MAKMEKKKERNLVRRKTVTGIPAVDEGKQHQPKIQPPSPSELQGNLKVVSFLYNTVQLLKKLIDFIPWPSSAILINK